MLSIMGNRQVRSYRLHTETVICAAGNRPEDDVLARALSESMRTRMTTMELKPDLETWSAWGLETDTIPAEIIGFLRSKPSAFVGKSGDTSRFPTPRGWAEVAVDFKGTPDPLTDILGDPRRPAWRTFVSLRCGEPTAASFWAWYSIVRLIDVAELLATGRIVQSSASKTADPVLQTHAAIFAITDWLRINAAKPAHKGIEVFVENLEAEYRVVFFISLTSKAKKQMEKHFPKALALCAQALVGS
jgi:hypothetical protein